MSNFVVYMIGIIIVVGGLGYGAYALGVAPVWIGIGAAVIFGFGLMGAVKKTNVSRDRDVEREHDH